MKKILQFSFAILLAYVASKFAFYLNDAYWIMSAGFWDLALLPTVIMALLYIAVRIFLVVVIVKYLRRSQPLIFSPAHLTDWETQSISQWLTSSLLVAVIMVLAFTVFLDFLSMIGIIAANVVLGL